MLKVDEPLKNHTTFRIGGPAKYFAEVRNMEELCEIYDLAIKNRLDFFILGNGSNILVSDQGFNGIVIRLCGEFAEYKAEGEKIFSGAGVRLAALVNFCSENSFQGIECLAGIPGTIGGALISNAGTSAGCIGDLISSVDVLSKTGLKRKLNRTEINFGYRSSNLEGELILRAEINLKKGTKNDILKVVKDIMLRRSKAQPLGTWNAGSIFKNPTNNSAGRLIEECGLKGLKCGDAQISEKHANFIINTGEAKASDVLNLIKTAQNKVKEKFGIDLETEIKVING